jgi:hypothetical protein
MSDHIKSLFIRQTFNVKETLYPSELKDVDSDNYATSIDSILLNKIKEKLGNKCNKHGYIEKDSIHLVTRSAGSINTTHFNGHMHFNIIVQANICHPSEGNTLVCKVIGTNKIGIFAVAEPVKVIVATAHHEDISIFENINQHDEILVEVINFKIKLNSDNIQVIGKFIKKL